MASGNIFVQVTATAKSSGRVKSIVVLVPREKIEDYRMSTKMPGDNQIARQLAEPLAMNLFTHRASFGNFKVAHMFSLDPPPEIEGKPPEIVRGGLKAWIL